ncbi:DUF6777 domain-containing protein [Streptomyces sp. NPDC006430]|uniref:DUF6777 domain-containing protein n=1 Tax=Streptomyces sp. NPDC006430 TaxID=3154299 RepID=UPI0033A53240
MHAPTPRQAPRRHAPARAALFTLLGLLAAACGASEETEAAAGPESRDVHLQPVTTAGPDPFTPSSATGESAPAQPPLPNPTGRGIRTVNAATPGLYGGTQRLGSCDVEQQLRTLTAEDAKARAFALVTPIEQSKIPEFLRGLTPVVLRADTRVTSHGFRDGRANGFQSVLQAGTAVLVDDHGMPRVRCAGGNPLLAPRAPRDAPVLKGEQWSGYQPHQVIVIEPTPQKISSLVIVNITDNTWLERKIGDAGAQDRTPPVVPPYDPAHGITTGPATPPGAMAEPCTPSAGNGPARTAPPAPPVGSSGLPAPGVTPCPPARGEDAPAAPSAPPRAPQQRPARPPVQPPAPPQSDVPPNLPGEVLPDAPADLAPGLPPQDPFDAIDPLAPIDPGTAPEPDGSVPLPPDTGDPYDPFAAAGQQPPQGDPAPFLGSA